MTKLHPVIAETTARIRERSRETRAEYLARIAAARAARARAARISIAAISRMPSPQRPMADKLRLRDGNAANIGIVTAYNDMLSAHQPLGAYPDIIKDAARAEGCTAQVAGGVPAMCDGITQGQPGMELSLFSRDVIALATAVALCHDAFDAALCARRLRQDRARDF